MKIGYFANQNDLGLKKPFHQVVAETREIAPHPDLPRLD